MLTGKGIPDNTYINDYNDKTLILNNVVDTANLTSVHDVKLLLTYPYFLADTTDNEHKIVLGRAQSKVGLEVTGEMNIDNLTSNNITGTIDTPVQNKITTINSLHTVGNITSGQISEGFGNINIGNKTIRAAVLEGQLSDKTQSLVYLPNISELEIETQ